MNVKSFAERLDQVQMFPYFTLSHIIVCTLSARADLGPCKYPRLRLDYTNSSVWILTVLKIISLIVFLQGTSARLLAVNNILHILKHNLGQFSPQRASYQCSWKHATSALGHRNLVSNLLFAL